MQNTMSLLAEAEKVKDLSAWAQELGLAKRVLYTAKYREHLSPSVAGVLAEKLGLDVQAWIVIAALESEKDSACKSRMVRRFLTGAALAGTLMGATGAATASVAAVGDSVYYVNLNQVHLRDKLTPLAMHWFARQQLVYARRLGLTGTRDLLNYLCVGLTVGSALINIQACLPY